MEPGLVVLATLLLVVHLWTPIAEAVPPPDKFPFPFLPQSRELLPKRLDDIVGEAEKIRGLEGEKWSNWLFGPDADTLQKKRQSLGQHGDLLDALKAAEVRGRPSSRPTSVPPVAKDLLQRELNSHLEDCIETAIDYLDIALEYSTGEDFDLPTAVGQCEAEYMVHVGNEEIRGHLPADLGKLEDPLRKLYLTCRQQGRTKQHCRHQTTAEVDGKTIKADTGFLTELQPPKNPVRDLIKEFKQVPERLFNLKSSDRRPVPASRYNGRPIRALKFRW